MTQNYYHGWANVNFKIKFKIIFLALKLSQKISCKAKKSKRITKFMMDNLENILEFADFEFS